MTKVCIFGAGSIGGYIAACLKKTDVDVSLVARGPHKEAIEKNGLTFIKNEKEENYKVRVTDDVKNLDVQDYIFISIKAHGITNIADSLREESPRRGMALFSAMDFRRILASLRRFRWEKFPRSGVDEHIYCIVIPVTS